MGAIKTRHLPDYSVTYYQRWEGDWELIKGIPFAMSPSATHMHQKVVGRLHHQLKNALDGNQRPGDVYYDLDLIIGNKTVVRPDLMILCGSIEGDYPTEVPIMIIEILTPGTSQFDREVKFEIYQEFGVLNYLIVNPDSKDVSVFLLENGKYHQSTIDASFEWEGCKIGLDWEGVFA